MEPHRLLGVRVGASPQEIRRAFATAARAVHPDTSGAAPDEAARRLAELVSARDRLLGAGGGGPVFAYHRRRGLRAVGAELRRLSRRFR